MVVGSFDEDAVLERRAGMRADHEVGGIDGPPAGLLTEKQTQRLDALFEGDTHVEVEATRALNQAMIVAYREPDQASGRRKMRQVIDSIARSRLETGGFRSRLHPQTG